MDVWLGETMNKKARKKITNVRKHPRHVPVSEKNPYGITIVDQHIRCLRGTYLDSGEIDSVFKNYNRKNLIWPTAGKLDNYKNCDKYDELIAVWTDYFNKRFGIDPPIDPDVLKALIASESSFRLDPLENRTAFGIAQITKATLKILQDPNGESKDFIFRKIRQKDLKDPSIAIPMAVRWLCRKNETARSKLGRTPTSEELILEYKGSGRPMKRLRRNKWFCACLGVLLSGCATSSYRVLFQDDSGAEVSVSPDRVLLECEDLYDADIKGLYGFMLHVLDGDNRVITFVQGNTLGKEDCERRLTGIGKVLKDGKSIYIAGRGNLSKAYDNVREDHVFPGKGTFRSSGKSLGFVAIANEHGLCYDAYSGFQEKPCPPEPFPFWTK